MNVQTLKMLVIAKYRLKGNPKNAEGLHKVHICIDGKYVEKEILVTKQDIDFFLEDPTMVQV